MTALPSCLAADSASSIFASPTLSCTSSSALVCIVAEDQHSTSKTPGKGFLAPSYRTYLRKHTFLAAGSSATAPFLFVLGLRGAGLDGFGGSSFLGCAARRDDRLVSVAPSGIVARWIMVERGRGVRRQRARSLRYSVRLESRNHARELARQVCRASTSQLTCPLRECLTR